MTTDTIWFWFWLYQNNNRENGKAEVSWRSFSFIVLERKVNIYCHLCYLWCVSLVACECCSTNVAVICLLNSIYRDNSSSAYFPTWILTGFFSVLSCDLASYWLMFRIQYRMLAVFKLSSPSSALFTVVKISRLCRSLKGNAGHHGIHNLRLRLILEIVLFLYYYQSSYFYFLSSHKLFLGWHMINITMWVIANGMANEELVQYWVLLCKLRIS